VGPDGSPEVTGLTEDLTYCARHPQVETGLHCGRCGTPICPRCLVQTPVGARCPDCANVRRLPTVDVPISYALRGLAAALASGAAVGAFWGYAVGDLRFVGFFTFLIALGIGWVISESVSAATNHKRGRVLQACAVAGVLLAYVLHNVVAGEAPLPAGDLWGYLATAVAAAFAASRLSG
jgi:hypothetical protein